MKSIRTAEWARVVYRNELGQFHREDGPAIITMQGITSWWYHGVKHRDNKPAVTWFEGSRFYWRKGKRVYAGQR